MSVAKRIAAALGCAFLAAGMAHAQQTVDLTNITVNGAPITGTRVFVSVGDTVKFDATLTQNTATGGSTGIGLCLEYNSSFVGSPTIANVFQTDLLGVNAPQSPITCANSGGSTTVTGANTQVNVGWARFTGGPTWPGVALPLKLFDASFAVTTAPAPVTYIGLAEQTGTGAFTTNGPIALCAKPTVAVGSPVNGAEPSTPGSFTVTLSSAIPVECGVSGVFPVTLTLGGTATAGVDYSIVNAGAVTSSGTTVTINYPANGTTTSQVVTFNVIDDTILEPTETVTLTVAAGSNNYGGVGATASADIVDNEVAPPTLSVSAVTNAAEPSTNGSFTVSRAGNQGAVTANITVGGTATRGTDYTLSTTGCATPTLVAGNTLSIGAGVSTVTVSICVIDDIATEGAETVILTIAPPTAGEYAVGTPTSQTATIADDDGPVTVTIAATTPNAAEPSTNGLFTVTRSGGGIGQVAASLTVNLTIGGTATNGTDYQTIATTVTIPANQTTATIPVTVIDDNLFEGDETVILTIASGTGYTPGTPGSATVTIADNEIGISVTRVSDAFEGASPGVFRICRTGSTASPLTVTFSLGGIAVLGTDFTLAGNATATTIVIAAGQLCNDLLVTVVNDAVQNPARDVTITLAASGGVAVVPGAGSASIALIDDELPRIIPTMSTWGMLLMGLMLAGIAGFTLRRRGIV